MPEIKPDGYKGLSRFHKYWGKKPIEYWRYLVNNLTEENDLVVDPFLGSGLIAKEVIGLNRKFIGIDINPFSIELTKLFMKLPPLKKYKETLDVLRKEIKPLIDKTYALSDNTVATHYLWQKDTLKLIWRKAIKGRERKEYKPSEFDMSLVQKYQNYQSKNIRNPKFFSNSRINSHKKLTLNGLFTGRALYNIDILFDFINNQPSSLRRSLLLTLTSSVGQMSKMVFAITRRGSASGRKSNKIEVGSWVIGYWRPKQHFEINVWNCFENKANKLIKAISTIDQNKNVKYSSDLSHIINNELQLSLIEGDSKQVLTRLPDSSVQLILTDPPHGDRIPYLELSELWNSILGKKVDFENEIVISNAKERNKNTDSYNSSITKLFIECERIVKENGFLSLIFNARSKQHWSSLEAIEEVASGFRYIGCFPMNYSAGSVVQDNRKGGLKNDFILLFCKTDKNEKVSKITNKFSSLPNWQQNYPKK